MYYSTNEIIMELQKRKRPKRPKKQKSPLQKSLLQKKQSSPLQNSQKPLRLLPRSHSAAQQ